MQKDTCGSANSFVLVQYTSKSTTNIYKVQRIKLDCHKTYLATPQIQKPILMKCGILNLKNSTFFSHFLNRNYKL